VAGVSRLLWQALQRRWPAGQLLTLLTDSRPGTLRSSTATRLAFGARIAATQVSGACAWTFYSHLSLAKVQRFLPPGVRRPYAVFLHGVEAWRPLDASDRRLLAGASLRVANSAHTATRVRESHPEIGPVQVCPLAVPPRWGEAATRSTAAVDPIGPHAVIIVARMFVAERYKGHDALLEAWPAVLARQPDAELVIVGGGDDQERLRAKARALGIDSRVLFTGFVDDARLEAIYGRAAVFAMPSRGEGFGLAYLEAMAHGLPCIGSIHDAAGEVIDDGVTGFLVDQADARALADRLALLLGDEARRRTMGEAGRRRLAERFTAERFSACLGDVIDAAFDPGPMSPAWRTSRTGH
jgi:phosphatidylinositol alpha-1,6-mannosyltransferase